MEAANNNNPLKRQHRDTLFRSLFKDPNNFLYLLKWCRGGKLDITIDDIAPFDLDSEVVQRVRRNDVSFLTTDNRLIILVEHQSTICPNMALRLLFYYVELLQLWIKAYDINIYGREKITSLPAPEFYVVYNGKEQLKDQLSTFELACEGMEINVQVKIVDVHFDKLEDIDTANTLAGYAHFYKVYDQRVQDGLSYQDAFIIARDECIANGYLDGFVEKEDFIMFYKDFLDYDAQLIAEGKAEGKTETLIDIAKRLLQRGDELQQIAELLQLDEAQVSQLVQAT